MLYLQTLNGFITYSFVIFIISSIISFFKKDGLLLKANLKIAGLSFLMVIIISTVNVFPRNDQQLLYGMIGLLCSILFSMFVNKARVDILSYKDIKRFVETLDEESQTSYKRDYFSTFKIVVAYLLLIWILSQFSFEGITQIQVIFALCGIIHAIVFSKVIGVCPYCNYKVHNITRRTAAINCRVCKSRIVIHGSKLARPIGRKKG